MASRSTRGARGTVSGPGAGQDFQLRSNLREVLTDLKEIDPKLATATRRRLRQSGDDAIDEMRQVLSEPSPGIVTRVVKQAGRDRRGRRRMLAVGVETREADRARSRGARAGVAGSLNTRVVAGRTRQTVRITGSGDPFARSYNLLRWRHPIRFDPATTRPSDVPWVQQAGRPYFGTVVARRQHEIFRRIDDALGEALDAIAANRSTPMEDM